MYIPKTPFEVGKRETVEERQKKQKANGTEKRLPHLSQLRTVDLPQRDGASSFGSDSETIAQVRATATTEMAAAK